MSNQRLLPAPEAAFTGSEKNSRAQLFELLPDEFTFAMSDSMPYGSSYFGRDVISGHAPRHYPKSDLSDQTSLPTE